MLTNIFLVGYQVHCVKSVCIRSLSGPHFPAFERNTKRCEVSLCIQSKCWKIRTRSSEYGHFHPVVVKRDASEIGCCVLPKEYNFLGLFWRISNFHWCVYWNTLIKSSLSVSVWQKDVVPLSLWGYLILQVLYLI